MDETISNSRWVRCPLCDCKTRIKVYEDTVLLNFPLYYPKCKVETMISMKIPMFFAG